MKPIALITGANRGLGLETARRLAEAGAIAIVGARDGSRGEAAAQRLRGEGLHAETVVLDVDSPASASAAADEIGARHGRLDILVNNAGILPEAAANGDRGPVDVDLFRRTFATNVFGAVAVIEAFLPLLQASETARIVNVSSRMGSLSDQLDPSSPYYDVVLPAYQASKAALNGVTVALSKLVPGTTVVSVCPGFVQTDLTPSSRSQAPLAAEEAGRFVAGVALDRCAPTGGFVDRDGLVAW